MYGSIKTRCEQRVQFEVAQLGFSVRILRSTGQVVGLVTGSMSHSHTRSTSVMTPSSRMLPYVFVSLVRHTMVRHACLNGNTGLLVLERPQAGVAERVTE